MKATLHVKGMTCAHCEAAVKGALEDLEGIQRVKVHLDTGEVDVTYEDAKVTIEEMRNLVEDQGYEVEQ